MSSDNSILWTQSFPLLRFSGDGTRRFLHGQTTSDFLDAEEGSLIHSCCLNAIGRLKAILEVKLDAEGANVLVLFGMTNELVRDFEKVIFPADKVLIDTRNSVKRLQILSSKDSSRFNDIFWILPDQTWPDYLKKIQKATSFQLERWRLHQGLPAHPSEINGETNPFELGLSDLISLNKGCYLGQETMSKLARTGGTKQQLRFFQTDYNVSAGHALISTICTSNDNKRAGFITSVLGEPNMGRSIGLAVVRNWALKEQELLLSEEHKTVRLSTPIGFISPPIGVIGN